MTGNSFYIISNISYRVKTYRWNDIPHSAVLTHTIPIISKIINWGLTEIFFEEIISIRSDFSEIKNKTTYVFQVYKFTSKENQKCQNLSIHLAFPQSLNWRH